jgi:hypothetical protein
MIAVVRSRRPQLILGWILSSVVAESVAVTFAFATVATDLRGVLTAALIEGGLLGLSQRWLLRTFVRPGFERGWLLATLAGAVLGRVVEFQADISSASYVMRWSQPAQFGAGVALGFVVGALMAAAQAFILRGRVRSAWRWMVARGLGWAFALPIIGVGSALLAGSLAGSTLGMLGVIAFAAVCAGAIEGAAIATLVAE